MDDKVFFTLVRLCRGNPEAPANRAARRVLVHGEDRSTARQETGVTSSTLSDAITRWRRVDFAIREAYGITYPDADEEE